MPQLYHLISFLPFHVINVPENLYVPAFVRSPAVVRPLIYWEGDMYRLEDDPTEGDLARSPFLKSFFGPATTKRSFDPEREDIYQTPGGQILFVPKREFTQELQARVLVSDVRSISW